MITIAYYSLEDHLVHLDVLDHKGEVSRQPVHCAVSLPPLVRTRPLAIALLLNAFRWYHEIAPKTDEIVLARFIRTVVEFFFDFEFTAGLGDVEQKSVRIFPDLLLNQVIWNEPTYHFPRPVLQNEKQGLFVLQILLFTEPTIIQVQSAALKNQLQADVFLFFALGLLDYVCFECRQYSVSDTQTRMKHCKLVLLFYALTFFQVLLGFLSSFLHEFSYQGSRQYLTLHDLVLLFNFFNFVAFLLNEYFQLLPLLWLI